MNDGIVNFYTAADLRKIGVSRARQRYWERKGLLKPIRLAGSREWRRYGAQDVQTARRIIHLIGLGLTLSGAERNLARLAEMEKSKGFVEALGSTTI